MKRLLLLFLCFVMPVIAMAQQRSIEIDAQSFAPVQQGALTGVAIDKIQPDHSKRPCARIKMRINRMSRADIDQLSVKIVGGNVALMRREVATEGNGLIIELTAKPETRFYLHHDKYGDSNEVNLNLEGNKEYRLEAELRLQQTIIINAGVEGADVYLDGEYKGLTNSISEITIGDVSLGSHVVRVQQNSLQREMNIEVTPANISFRVELNTAQSRPQWLVLQVEPKDAMVVIDGNVCPADAQGFVQRAFPNGTHTYTISAKDYHTESGTFVIAGEKIQRNISLRPAYGWLSIPESEILNGATVYVDNTLLGTVPFRSDKLASGQHSVLIVKELYKNAEASITISDGETYTYTPTLVANYGTVTINAGGDFDIYANGKLLGRSPWSGNLTADSYIFEARMEGYEPSSVTRTVVNGSAVQSIDIPAPKAILGYITVVSSPAMATVMVDGKAIGTTPLTENVLIGKHKLSIVADGYTTYEKDIYITKDCNEEINVALNVKKLTYKVGDYYDDGTKQGVVFYVDATGKHGKIVSLDQVTKQWCNDKQYKKKIVVGASSESDGKANTDKVMSRSDSAAYYAFVWCRAKGNDWYLPARDELMLLYSVRDAINRTLCERGGDAISAKWHWSSTESSKSFAWYVSMYNGYTGSLDKYGTCYVRAVSAF
ncbi:MAG: PEGA domain-containing protein [Alistipes sp.]|nr:PEGA domain-containing protein [Alistipes sp.]